MLTSAEVIERLTPEQIIDFLVQDCGADKPIYDSQGNIKFCTALCHGGDSYKLYFFSDSKRFYCFSHCHELDLFEIVRRNKGFEQFYDAFLYIIKYFQLNEGFQREKVELTSDWDIFQKIADYTEAPITEVKLPKPINENLLDYYYPIASPHEWVEDNISPDVMADFGIRVDPALHKVIIPHRNIDGQLIGIRGRSYDPFEVADGKKYMPVFIEGEMYAHELGKNLYGLYENQDTIKKLKTVLIFESEKSVLQCRSYGIDYAVATCGSSISQTQADLLLGVGVEQAIICYDREYEVVGTEEYSEYRKKLLTKIAKPLLTYMNVYVVLDRDNIIGIKDSPSDRGKDILERLLKKKIYASPLKAK